MSGRRGRDSANQGRLGVSGEARLLNRQDRVRVDILSLGGFVRRLRRAARLGRREFNVCLVSDAEIRRLNSAYRRKPYATDVLSFPWQAECSDSTSRDGAGEFRNFLGDIVISVESARRGARREAHSTLNELRWLILHGVLHLLGYDHERDQGEMNEVELALREKLGIAGQRRQETPGARRVRHG